MTGAVIGWVTSGGYGHQVRQSIALGYVPAEARYTGRPGRRASRSRSSSGGARPRLQPAAVRPRGPPDAPVTGRRSRRCGADRRRRGRADHSSTRRPVRVFQARDSLAMAILRAGGAGPWARRGRCAWRGLRELPGGGRWYGVSAAPPRLRGTHPVSSGERAIRTGRLSFALPGRGRPGPLGDPTPGHHRVPPCRADVAVPRWRIEWPAGAAEAQGGAGRSVLVLDAGAGEEIVAVYYAGPLVVVRPRPGMLYVHAHEIVVPTGGRGDPPGLSGNRLGAS